jgi:hypothetical protein
MSGIRMRLPVLLGALALGVVSCSADPTASEEYLGLEQELTEVTAERDALVAAIDNGFPTGRFIEESLGVSMFEFDEEGKYRYYEAPDMTTPAVSGWYGISGVFSTEMTHDWPTDRKIPATYVWDYDGQTLTFELFGEDVIPHRKGVYGGSTYVRTEEGAG